MLTFFATVISEGIENVIQKVENRLSSTKKNGTCITQGKYYLKPLMNTGYILKGRSFMFYFLHPNEINTDIISLLSQAGLEKQVDYFWD